MTVSLQMDISTLCCKWKLHSSPLSNTDALAVPLVSIGNIDDHLVDSPYAAFRAWSAE